MSRVTFNEETMRFENIPPLPSMDTLRGYVEWYLGYICWRPGCDGVRLIQPGWCPFCGMDPRVEGPHAQAEPKGIMDPAWRFIHEAANETRSHLGRHRGHP